MYIYYFIIQIALHDVAIEIWSSCLWNLPEVGALLHN